MWGCIYGGDVTATNASLSHERILDQEYKYAEIGSTGFTKEDIYNQEQGETESQVENTQSNSSNNSGNNNNNEEIDGISPLHV